MNEKYFTYQKKEKNENIFGKIDKFWKIGAYIGGLLVGIFLILDSLIFTNTFNFSYATLKDFYLGSFDIVLSEILVFIALVPLIIASIFILIPYLVSHYNITKLKNIKINYIFYIIYYSIFLIFSIYSLILLKFFIFSLYKENEIFLILCVIFLVLSISHILTIKIFIETVDLQEDKFTKGVVLFLIFLIIIINILTFPIYFIITLFFSIEVYFTILFIEAKISKPFKRFSIYKKQFQNFLKILLPIYLGFILYQFYSFNKAEWNEIKQNRNFISSFSFNLFLNPLFLKRNYENIDINISRYDFLNHSYFKNCLYVHEDNQTKQILDINSSTYVLSLSQTNKLYFKKEDTGICIYAVKVKSFRDQEFYKLIDIGYIKK